MDMVCLRNICINTLHKGDDDDDDDDDDDNNNNNNNNNDNSNNNNNNSGPGSSVGIATEYGLEGPGIKSQWGEIFRRPDRPRSPPSLLLNVYRFFPGGRKRPGLDTDPSPPSSAVV